MAEVEQTFTYRMRKATRSIHSVSDALVNAKFAISLRDEVVWGKGLFVFYHVFAYLEDASARLDIPEFKQLFVHETLYRKKAFESDLKHYLGDNWASLPKPQALENYLQHLQDLERDNPRLLMAYVYHLYLGLLSGGQILAKKRGMTLFGSGNQPNAYTDQLTDFSKVNINELKQQFKNAMNEIATTMSEEEQLTFIEESKQVFIMNNLVVNSIEGQNQVLYNILYKVSAAFLVLGAVVAAFKMHK